MKIREFGSYFNPKSVEHHAVRDFTHLKGWQQALTVIITAISIPLLFGVGSIALFRVLTKSFTAKPLNPQENGDSLERTASKTARSSSSISSSSPSSSISATRSTHLTSWEEPFIAPLPSKFCIKYDRSQTAFVIGSDLEFVKTRAPYLFEGHETTYQMEDGSPIRVRPGDYLVFVTTWIGERPTQQECAYEAGIYLPGSLIRDLKLGEALFLRCNGAPFTLTLSQDNRFQGTMNHERLVNMIEWNQYDEKHGTPEQPVLPGNLPTHYPHIKYTLADEKAAAELKAQITEWAESTEECRTFVFNVAAQTLDEISDFAWDTETEITPTDSLLEIEGSLSIDIPGAKELVLSCKGPHLFAHFKGIAGRTFGCCLNTEILGLKPADIIQKKVNQEMLATGIFVIDMSESPAEN